MTRLRNTKPYNKAKSKAEALDNDVSMWDAMAGLTGSTYGGGRDDPVIQFAITNDLEFNTGASASQISAWYGDDDSKFTGAETVLQTGYSRVPLALQAGSVRLGSACSTDVAPTITAVSSGKTSLNVIMGQKVTGITLASPKITLATASGGTYQADHVVITVPLGVLKAGIVTFSPALPATTQSAIDRIGFGNVVKVGLLFNQVFWDNTQYFGLAVDGGLTNAEKFTYFMNVNGAVNRPVLFTFVFGLASTPVEALSDSDAWAQIRVNLVKIFGETAVASGGTPKMWRSTWASDPLFRGAYSYGATGIKSPSDWNNIGQQAYNNQLHFAGEHTNKKYRGTVHGAFFSGHRAACEVLAAQTRSQASASNANSTKFAKTSYAGLIHWLASIWLSFNVAF